MLFSWWNKRRRSKILQQPFPTAWEAIIVAGVRVDAVLPEKHRIKLRQAVQIIVAEKDWEGCRGLKLSDEIRVTIAALAAVLVLGLEDCFFDTFQTILVYPDAYVVTEETSLAGGATMTQQSVRLGEAHRRGSVTLSWDSVRNSGLHPGRGENLVFHEFAHQLDMLNGEFDGTPALPTRELRERWATIMDREFRRLQQADRRGRRTLLDPYGATNPAEFFAVATECFFDDPQAMKREYPDLYDLFRAYYCQDPASWHPFKMHAPG